MNTIEMLSNVAEITPTEARSLLRSINRQGVTSKTFLKAVNDYSNFTGKSFMESFNTWKDKALYLLVVRDLNKTDYYGI